MRARSGFPFNPFVSSWFDEPALPFEPLVSRPDYDAVHPVWLVHGRIPGGRGLNTAAFPIPPRSSPGTLGRNSIRGFFFHQVDLAVHRSFRLAQGPTVLELRAEAFNAFNRPNLNAPALSVISSFVNPPYFAPTLLVSQFVGRSGTGGDPSTGLLPLFQIGGPRSMQLSVRLAF